MYKMVYRFGLKFRKGNTPLLGEGGSMPKVRFGQSDSRLVKTFASELVVELEKLYKGDLPNDVFELMMKGGVPVTHIAKLVKVELDASASPERGISDPDEYLST